MSADSSAARSRFVCLVLVLLTLLAYLPARHFGFLPFDDPEYVADNRIVQAGLTWAGLKWAFSSPHFQLWIPLTWLSHMLDCELFGLDPGAQHMVNVLLHSLNSALVFLIWLRLTEAFWPSALVAALFAWHPLRVESVAWVAERKDVLCAFFWMLTLWAWTRHCKRQGPEPGPGKAGLSRYYFFAFGFFLLGLMSKPMIVTLPFALLLLDYWPLRRGVVPGGRTWLKLFVEKWPFFLLSFLFCAVTVLASRGNALTGTQYPLGLRLENAVVSYGRYLLKTFWPERLAILYPLPSHWPASNVAIAAIVLALLSGLAWWGRREHPHLLMGWLWFLGTLVPVIGLVQVGGQAMADRFSYLPSLGLFIAVVFEAGYWVNRLGPARLCFWAGLAAGLVLIAYLFGTERQLGYWKSNVSLFAQAVAVGPDNAVARVNLGLALEQQGRREQARVQYESALRIDPSFAQAHVDLGNVLNSLGEPQKALYEYREGVRLDPGALVPRLNLGSLLSRMGDSPGALAEYDAAAQLAPDDPRPPYLKGKALLRQGRTEEALACFRAALQLAPSDVPALTWLARVLATGLDARFRNGAEALVLAERANTLSGGADPVVLDVLAMAYADQGRFDEACKTAQAAIERAGHDPDGESLAAMQERLRLYQEHKAYREPSHTL